MHKIATIVGARPQFIKAAVVSRLMPPECQEVIIHTGQHYDYELSDSFFDELEIPPVAYNLGIGSGTHAEQTGKMLPGLEQILLSEQPDLVLLYGDTNSTLAGALAAVKLHLPIAHVEAGARNFSLGIPEEVNRVITDRLSALLFCATQTSVLNLEKEGLFEGVFFTGDVMFDLHLAKRASVRQTMTMNGCEPFLRPFWN
jgi:UDP-N-acetylglucosamine 2-epimerase (non-hydrolysing)/UDP-GlcNAc3NAcA epimerase